MSAAKGTAAYIRANSVTRSVTIKVMRNTGWYIPYWRKPRKKGRGGGEKPVPIDTTEVMRSDEQLETVRQSWIERYRRTLHALDVLGLSMGSNRGEVQAGYETLRRAGTVAPRDLEDAYRHLQRILPATERRKKRAARDRDLGSRGDDSRGRPSPFPDAPPLPRSRNGAGASLGAQNAREMTPFVGGDEDDFVAAVAIVGEDADEDDDDEMMAETDQEMVVDSRQRGGAGFDAGPGLGRSLADDETGGLTLDDD